MQKTAKSSAIGIIIGLLLATSFSVLAFTEPTVAPPGGNVAAPINVSGTAQTKTGDLTVNNFFAKNFSVAPGVSEYNITNVNNVTGFNDLFLKGNSTETAPVYIAGSEIKMYTNPGTGGVERLTITSTGNVGIGTSDFTALDVHGVSAAPKLAVGGMTRLDGLLLVSGGDIGAWAGNLSGNSPRSWIGRCPTGQGCSGVVKAGEYFHISGWSNPNYGSYGGNTARVLGLFDVVLIPGNLGVGTNDPQAKLHVVGTSKFEGVVEAKSPSGSNAVLQGGDGSSGLFVIRNNASVYAPSGILITPDRVGIDTYTPRYKLDVSGDFGANKICVGGPCFGGVLVDVNGGHIQWGNNSILATDQGGAIELGGDNTTPGAGIPYIDFHQAGITQDFNARIINDVNGKLTLEVPTVYASNNINANDVFIRASGKWASQLGGITSESDTLQSVVNRGNYAWQDISIGGRFASQNRSVACPNGWGCGVHTWDVYADASIYGTYIHSPNKFFSIPHPLDPENKILVHATIEGPESAVFYRGEAVLQNGRALIVLPNYFEALTRKEGRTVLLTNIDGFDRLAVQSQDGETIKNGQFAVTSNNPNSSQRFFWEVKAVRADVKPLKVERSKNELPYDEDQLPKGVTKPDYAK